MVFIFGHQSADSIHITKRPCAQLLQDADARVDIECVEGNWLLLNTKGVSLWSLGFVLSACVFVEDLWAISSKCWSAHEPVPSSFSRTGDLREAAMGRDVFEELQTNAGQPLRRFTLHALGFEILRLCIHQHPSPRGSNDFQGQVRVPARRLSESHFRIPRCPSRRQS